MLIKTRKVISLQKLQTGTSLVEVLVSVIIIAIGMLGLAALQNTSLKLSYQSYIRSQATFLAYDLIDRIRANPDAQIYELTEDATVSQTDCFASNTNGCSVSEMREFDLYYWREQAKELLPDAIVEVTYDDSQQLYSMRINWEDRFENDIKGDEVKEFIYHFQISN